MPQLAAVSADDVFDLDAAPTGGLTRRGFLAAAAAAGGVAMLPGWVLSASEAFAAEPLGPGDGVLVLVTLGGGNDGLNTVIPVEQGRYRDLRKSLAIAPETTLPLQGGCALHPSLVGLKGLWDQGKVAVVQGVGYPDAQLSHFDSMAVWMSGQAAPGWGSTGWLGRYLDGLGGDDSLQAVTIGTSTAQVLQGDRREGTALPLSMSGAFGASRRDANDARMYDAVLALAQGPHRGAYGAALAESGRSGTELAGVLAATYDGLPSAAWRATWRWPPSS